MSPARVQKLPVLVAVLAACGGVLPAAPHDPSPVPSTEHDPLTWTPTATPDAETGGAVGVSTSGALDQARSVAIRFMSAVHDRDQPALERLLAERLERISHPSARTFSRAEVIAALLRRRASRRGRPPTTGALDPSQLEVVPLATAGVFVPEGLSPGDLLVRFGAQNAGLVRRALGWAARAGLVVRPGVEPHIVAL